MKKQSYILLSLLMCLCGLLPAQEYPGDSMMHYYNKGNFTLAIEWGIKNMEGTKKLYGDTSALYGTSVNNLASMYFRNGNFQKARDFFMSAADIYKTATSTVDSNFLFILNNAANAAFKMGAYHEAELLVDSIIKTHASLYGKENQKYGTYINSLGLIYKYTGRPEMALQNYQQALQLFKQTVGVNSIDYISTITNIAAVYVEMGKYLFAESALTEAVQIKKNSLGEDNWEYGHALNNLAALYFQLGNFRDAISGLEKALPIIKNQLTQYHPLYNTVLNNLASAYTKYGRYQLADSMLSEVVQNQRNKPDRNPLELAANMHNLGMVHRELTKNVSSIQLLTEALGIREKSSGKLSQAYLQSLNGLATQYTRMGQFNIADSLFANITLADTGIYGIFNSEYLNLLASKCDYFLLSGKESEIINIIPVLIPRQEYLLKEKLDYLSEKELLAYIQDNQSAYHFLYISLLQKSDDKTAEMAYNNQLLLKSVALQNSYSLQNEIAGKKDSILYNMWKTYTKSKSQLVKALSTPVSKRTVNTDSLAYVTNQAEKELLRRSNIFKRQKDFLTINWRQVRDSLNDKETAIEFVRFRKIEKNLDYRFHYAALVIRHNSLSPQFIYLSDEETLQKSMSDFLYRAGSGFNRPAIGSRVPQKAIPASVYRLIWAPLEKHLAGSTTIYYSPTGLLHKLSFAALKGTSAFYLSDRYNLVQLSSTRQVIFKRQKIKKTTSIALFGGINYNNQSDDPSISISTDPYRYAYRQHKSNAPDTFDFLNNSVSEISTIRNIMEQKGVLTYIATSDTATEKKFRKLSAGVSPDIIHFATHGFYLDDELSNSGTAVTLRNAEDPLLKCGLLLSGGNMGWRGLSKPEDDDGILTGLEVSSSPLMNTELAVLSACRTAEGVVQGNEGVFGLQRAFKKAGVNYVLGTLWSVPDIVANKFMSFFYQHISSGKSIRDSYFLAQKEMKKNNSPYMWAAFVLIQ